jgi:putative ABC transport system permease protein
MSPAAYDALRARSRSFEQLAAYQTSYANVAFGADASDPIPGVDASPDLFAVLRIRPHRGRLFSADEAIAGSNVLLISHELWTTRLGGGENVIGSAARVNGVLHTIIGVLPPRFNFPERNHYWKPLVSHSNSPGSLERSLSVAARLRDGSEFASARAEVATIGAAFAREHPATQERWSFTLRPDVIERRSIPGPVQWMMLTAGVFLMLIACANVTTVLLARAATRRSEMAVRAALGASRGRLVRQHLAETLLIALAGGMVGVFLATWMLDLAWALLPTQRFPSWIDLGVDWRVLAFTSAAAFVALLAVGIGPALAATRVQLSDALKLGAPGDTGSRRELRTSRVLVVAEVAAAFVLFAGSALMLDSFRRLQHVDFGLQADRVLVARPWLSAAAYPTDTRRRSYYDLAMERVRRVPGIGTVAVRGDLDSLRGAAWASDSFRLRVALVPLSGSGERSPTIDRDMIRHVVTPEYFDAVKLPVLRGRVFTPRDDSGSTRVAVVSTLVADHLWPNADAIGRQFRFAASAEWIMVVGVVGNARVIVGGNRGPRTRVLPAVYFPASQATSRNDILVMESRDPIAVSAAVTQSLRAVDPDQSVGRVTRLLDDLESPREGSLWFGLTFAAIASGALVLSSIGLYGVIAYSVTRRTREIGVRMALGADARALRLAVVGQSLRLTLAGLAIGVAGASGLVRVTGTFLGGETGSLAVASTVVAILFVLCAIVASAVPARRATRVDPLVALRAQ